MTFVVTENCIKCKYQDCVEVCPVDCFYEGPNFLVINPMNVLTVHYVNQSAQQMQFSLKMSYLKAKKYLLN